MTIKLKRKYDTHTFFKLKLILITFIVGTVLATFYPMVWLAPPLFAFTPFVYIGLSLLWVPILWRNLHRVVWDKVFKILILGCLLSSIFMTFFFQQNLTGPLKCYGSDGIAHSCQISFVEHIRCESSGFWVIDMGLVVIAKQSPWNSTLGIIFCPMF